MSGLISGQMQFSSTYFGGSVEPQIDLWGTTLVLAFGWMCEGDILSSVWMNYVKPKPLSEHQINVSVQLPVFSAWVSYTGSVMSGCACVPLCIYTFTRTHVCHCGLSVSWDEFAFTAFRVTPAAAAVPWGQRSELQKIMSWQIERRQTDGPITVGFTV